MEDEKTLNAEESMRSELSSDLTTKEALKDEELDQVAGGAVYT